MKQTVTVKLEFTMSYDDVEWTSPDLIKTWIRTKCWETLMTEGEPSDEITNMHDWEVPVVPKKED